MSDTSKFGLVGNSDKRQDGLNEILDMSLEDILRMGLTSPVEDIEDNLSGYSAVDNEIGRGSSVWGDDHFGDKENVSSNHDGDNELVSQNGDQHQYATRAEVHHLSKQLGELREIIGDQKRKSESIFAAYTDQQQQLKEQKSLLTAQQVEIEEYKNVLADVQSLMNKQLDLVSKQAAQIRQLEKCLSESQ